VYYIVQPSTSGADRGRQATVVSTHEFVAAAYAELDQMVTRLNSYGLAGDVVELLVVDENREPLARPGVQ
jgi:hypothetical protein